MNNNYSFLSESTYFDRVYREDDMYDDYVFKWAKYGILYEGVIGIPLSYKNPLYYTVEKKTSDEFGIATWVRVTNSSEFPPWFLLLHRKAGQEFEENSKIRKLFGEGNE